MSEQIKIRTYQQGGFPINHDLAGLVPMALPSEQVSLCNDIALHGQREPIVLWQGAIVDGRCRQKALLSLEKFIIYKELDDKLTYDEVKAFVKSVNTRRNLTISQKIAIAAKEYITDTKSVKQVASAWGISTSILDNGIWLVKHYPGVIEELFNGNGVMIKNSKGLEVMSTKVTAIFAHYRRIVEDVEEDTQYGWKIDGFIKTQAGKDWYYTTKRDEELGVYNRDYNRAELANYKFPLRE